MAGHHDRYQRQAVLGVFGAGGQDKLGRSTAVIIGCGGLGCGASALLARAGVGHIRLVDPDVVEEVNLHRQALFIEDDARAAAPKALAAARRLTDANSFIRVEGVRARAEAGNIEALVSGATVVLDGTDNAESRFLVNDACVKAGIPWVYAGAIETRAVCMAVNPSAGPCMRCVFPDPPAAGSMRSCREVGVLNAAVSAASSMQAAQAIRFMATGSAEWGLLMSFDAWTGDFRQAQMAKSPDCPACGRRLFEFL